MDDCAKETAVAGLYDDLTVDILSRLPVKDVRRSKCVSKPWRDLIADPLHRKKLPQTLEGFFHGGDDNLGHFTSLSGNGECVDPSFSFLTAKLPRVEGLVLLDSCNGLLLFGCHQEGKSGYIVCNPATEELVTVPASPGSCPALPHEHPLVEESYVYSGQTCALRQRTALTYLMFDPVVSSRFHLVQFWKDRRKAGVETVHSYSSETRAWSDRSSKWERGKEELWGQAIIKFMYGRTLFNGLLHFVIYHVQKDQCHKDDMIVAVDGEGKICTIMCWPLNHILAEAAFIGQSQGHLHCIGSNLQVKTCFYHFTQLSVWVLENYDTQEWILKHNVSCSQLFGSLSCPIDKYNIVAIHPDHNLIILVQHRNQKLVSYDLDSKELRVVCTLGEGYQFITPYVPCFIESPVLATKK